MYSNRYIFIYASVMVVVVAVVLSTIATLLKPMQDANIKMEKIQSILASFHIESTQDNAFELFENHIKHQYIVNYEGSYEKGNAFDVDLRVELRKPIEERQMPLFEVSDLNNRKNYVIPLYGGGLWGPIWGYMALKEDFKTINGVIFDHQGETPGLGAEISTPVFEKQFKDKRIFDKDHNFVSVKVVKGGAAKDDPHAVDGISGGTITSDGVSDMLKNNIRFYLNFYEQNILTK